MVPPNSWDPRYVESHLFAYIGNKRRLLPLISQALERVQAAEDPAAPRGLFVDFFAGTGVVSRMARSQGYPVWANDWEDYTRILNTAFVGGDASDLELFAEEGGFDQVLADLNALSDYREEDAYLSRFYCPANDAAPDVAHERLFYTRANGIRLDNIRAEIERRYPAGQCDVTERKRNLLLSLLLLEASHRANTSGVFKGFHQGFGGLGADALGRILGPVTLTRPVLPAGLPRGTVTGLDAVSLAARMADEQEIAVAYLDPPYNQHQYGSNYHLLNTLVRNDRPAVSRGFIQDGKKVDKSAIRKDWVKTRSPFCYRATALREFRTMVQGMNARHILVSYSTDGLIPIEDMLDVLAERGEVDVVTSPYVKYRGGRQSNVGKNRNLEFVLMAHTRRAPSLVHQARVKRSLLVGKLEGLLAEPMPVDRCEMEVVGIPLVFRIPLDRRLRIRDSFRTLWEPLPLPLLERLYRTLKGMAPESREEEIARILELLAHGGDLDRTFLARRVFTLFAKIHPQKSRQAFLKTAALLKSWLKPGTPFDPDHLDPRSRRALDLVAA